MQLKVTAFDCTEFKQEIPDMNGDASIGFCLVESRDFGIYLAAMFDHLRTIQNTFLREVAGPQQNQATTEGSYLSVRVQMCKVGFRALIRNPGCFDAVVHICLSSEFQMKFLSLD